MFRKDEMEPIGKLLLIQFQFQFVTGRKRSLGQGNIFIGVCQEFCSQGGVSASVHAGIHPPREQTPSGADTPGSRCPQKQTPLEQTPPPQQTPPGADPPRSRHTPLRSRHPPPPRAEHAGRYSQCTGGTHPTGMHSCYIIYLAGVFKGKKRFFNSLRSVL